MDSRSCAVICLNLGIETNGFTMQIIESALKSSNVCKSEDAKQFWDFLIFIYVLQISGLVEMICLKIKAKNRTENKKKIRNKFVRSQVRIHFESTPYVHSSLSFNIFRNFKIESMKFLTD